MKLVRVKDCHPGKWQDGIELFLVNATKMEHSDGRIFSFITGFRDPSSNDNRGMFDVMSEPVQEIEQDSNGNWLFTMGHITNISRDEVSELVKNGSYRIIRKFEDGYIYFDLKLEILK